jgi:hypothetical protein
MRAYVQYLNAYGEWQVTERMSVDNAKVVAKSMMLHQQAFIRVCN